MVKPNYGFQKRQRELAKKQKKEAKRQKAAASDQALPEAQDESLPAGDAGASLPGPPEPAPE